MGESNEEKGHLMQPLQRTVRRRVGWGLVLGAFLTAGSVARADGPRDNLPDNVRPIPPAGIAVPDAERAELEKGVAQLGKEIEALRESLKAKPQLLALLPDVQIYDNAVRYALK